MLSKERKDAFMIRRFEVENFKGFKDKLVFDLTAGKYGFNQNIVVNGIVNKAIVYGKNGVGKSTLGIAMFDIVRHLTDKERMNAMYLRNYINLDSNEKIDIFDALHGYTYMGAYGMGVEDKTGSLEPGKLADIAVINGRIFDEEPEKLLDRKAVLTMMDGRIVYEDRQ